VFEEVLEKSPSFPPVDPVLPLHLSGSGLRTGLGLLCPLAEPFCTPMTAAALLSVGGQGEEPDRDGHGMFTVTRWEEPHQPVPPSSGQLLTGWSLFTWLFVKGTW
jgi:hypothetical protein